jgi:hypothetical protein
MIVNDDQVGHDMRCCNSLTKKQLRNVYQKGKRKVKPRE